MMSKESEFVFTWRIENYSCCYQKRGKVIKSPKFQFENSWWLLRVYPKGLRLNEDEHFVSFFLKWDDSDEWLESPAIDYTLEMLGENGKVMKCYEVENRVFTKTADDWGFAKFCSIDELNGRMASFKEDVLILRCRFKCKPQMLSGSEACTTISVDRSCAEWDVKKPLYIGCSDSINFSVFESCKFEVVLKSSPDLIAILIHLKKGEIALPFQTSFKITFYGKQKIFASKRVSHLFESKETWEFPNFITREMLEECKISSFYYNFRLKCEVKVAKNSIASCRRENFNFNTATYFDSTNKNQSISATQNDFRNFFMNSKFSDATVRVESKEFPVHKLILGVRSPVFAAMFDQDMQESKTGVVNVADVEENTMSDFLRYLYTENVNMDYESAKKLMLVADKYQVLSLVNRCSSYLKSMLSVENVCEIILIADSISADDLKSFGIDFIKSNAAVILATPEWSEWIKRNILLATEILSKLSIQLSSCFHHSCF